MGELANSYLFLELAVLVFVIGFAGDSICLRDFTERHFVGVTLALAIFWFAIDEIAVGLGLWTFPVGCTLPIRVLSLPLEEYLLFVLHPLICLVLLNHFLSHDP